MDEMTVKNIEIFNNDLNQQINKFGVVNVDFIKLEENPKLLFYYYPMIERLVRCILNMYGTFDIMNSGQYTFKTLYSIVFHNEEIIKEVFGEEFGDQLFYYITETYCPDGIRNKIMHYNEGEVPTTVIESAKYIFLCLIEYYVENFTVREN